MLAVENNNEHLVKTVCAVDFFLCIALLVRFQLVVDFISSGKLTVLRCCVYRGSTVMTLSAVGDMLNCRMTCGEDAFFSNAEKKCILLSCCCLF